MKQSLKSLTIPKLGLTITKQKDVFLQGTVFEETTIIYPIRNWDSDWNSYKHSEVLRLIITISEIKILMIH